MNTPSRYFSIIIGAAIIGGFAAMTTESCAGDKWRMPVHNKHDDVVRANATPFPPGQVRLLDGPFKDAMERDRKYLRGLEVDRLLHNFRVTAGLPSSAKPLGGWESPQTELRGHFVGHFLTACALMYASAGDGVLKAKADSVVEELEKCQVIPGDGYLGAFPEEFFERVETGKKVWAPWYTLHKIFAGLLDMYVYCGNKKALEVVKRLASWAKKRTDRLDDNQMQNMLNVEFGGMNDVLFNLYAVTGDSGDLALARRFYHKGVLDPLANDLDKLKGLHVNTQIPKVIGAARGYELTGDRDYHEIATYFWNQVTGTRSYATGGTSYDEHWASEPYQLSPDLGTTNQESCTSYNLLKLTQHLFTWNPDPRYADYYERVFFNGILPTQDPDSGMLMYYLPLGSGWFKTFGTPRNSFWCCTGTGVESFAKLGNSIYYHDSAGVFVNLFISSELEWAEKSLRIRQETSFPEQQGTSLTISSREPVNMSLFIRIPFWTNRMAQVKINGKKLDNVSGSPGYMILNRTWKNGDRVEVELPMRLHLQRMPDNPNRAAVLFGPIVLAGKLGNDGINQEAVYGPAKPSSDPVRAPFFVVDNDDVDFWMKPVPGKPLTFQSRGVGIPNDVVLVPLYRLFRERYAVYWDIYTNAEWRAMKASDEKLSGNVIDSVKIGDSTSHQGHHFFGFSVQSGVHEGRNWVSTSDWFRYTVRVPIDKPVALTCAWLPADTARVLEIFIDGTAIRGGSSRAENSHGYNVQKYAVPMEITHGKKEVSVMFKTQRGHQSRKLFGCAVLKE